MIEEEEVDGQIPIQSNRQNAYLLENSIKEQLNSLPKRNQIDEWNRYVSKESLAFGHFTTIFQFKLFFLLYKVSNVLYMLLSYELCYFFFLLIFDLVWYVRSVLSA